MTKSGSANGKNQSRGEGFDSNGYFAKGNKHGKGNPFVKRVSEFRKAYLNAVSAEEIAQLAQVMMKKALKGDMIAARELLSRCLGKAEAIDTIMEVERLSKQVQQLIEAREKREAMRRVG